MPLRLIIEDDEGTTTIVPLGRDAITIGRQQGNTIQLTEKNVSRRHARLYPDDGETWVIEDLGSYNGIKVNAQSVQGTVQLKEGDVVQIGDYHLALTHDADQRTVNYEPQAAANDVAPSSEPLLASSSTDLPRLSPEELAALSNPSAASASPGAGLGDSASMSSMPAAAPDEPKRSGVGLLVGFGVVVAAALGLGFVWLNQTGNEAPPVADKGPAKNQAAKTAEPASTKPVVAAEPDPEPPPEPTTAMGDEGSLANGSGGLGAQTPVPPEEGADPAGPAGTETEPENEAGQAPSTSSGDKGSSRSRRRKARRERPRPDRDRPSGGTQPKPPTPSVDADALLSEAQGLQISNPTKAYELAKQSYAAKRSQTAAAVMAFTACRMGDAAKAKYALSKLRGSKREQMAEQCRKKGLDV